MFGKKHLPETRAKISASKKGENNPNYGKPRSPETCAKISEAVKAALAQKKLLKLSANHDKILMAL